MSNLVPVLLSPCSSSNIDSALILSVLIDSQRCTLYDNGRENCHSCHIKSVSYRLSLLIAVTGLFSSLSLSAQKYHDAATFGLKGNVKEVKVIHQKTGNISSDIYDFSELSFGRDGRLERWSHLGEDYIIPDDGREGTLILHGSHPSETAGGDLYLGNTMESGLRVIPYIPFSL